MKSVPVVALSLTATLMGCVTTSEVVPIGKNSYAVSVNAGGPAAGSEKILAIKAANNFCAGKGLKMMIGSQQNSGLAFGTRPQTSEVTFSCVAEDDPAYKTVTLRPDNGVTTTESR